MNIVVKILMASVDFLAVSVVLSLNGGLTVYDIMWYSLSIGLGFSLRIAVLVNNNKYSHRLLLINASFTICWVFFAILLWRTKLQTTWMNQGGNSFEIYLFLNALFAAFLVSQLEYFFKVGFVSWLKINAGRLIAKDGKGGDV